MTIAKKHAQTYMPNGEVSLEQVIQAAGDEQQAAKWRMEWAAAADQVDGLRERIRQLEAERVRPLADGIKNGVLVEADDLRLLMQMAGLGDGYDEDDAASVVFWIGETIDFDGDKEVREYGLNYYNTEVPEEGSICLVNMQRPAILAVAPQPKESDK